jgi:hypothetical protein
MPSFMRRPAMTQEQRQQYLLWNQTHPFAALIRDTAVHILSNRECFGRSVNGHQCPTWKEELQNIQLKGDRYAKTPQEFAELRKVYIFLAALNIDYHPLTTRPITDITSSEIGAFNVLFKLN